MFRLHVDHSPHCFHYHMHAHTPDAAFAPCYSLTKGLNGVAEKQAVHEAKSRDARIEEGAKRRERASRAGQKELKSSERKFDPVDVVLASGAGRLARLLPIKYARMAVSPFAFFRGAVGVMAADLGRLPHSGIEVQLCGDAHVQNLGSFAAPDGRLVFDFNDFDESIRGPWEWDVKRMAASIVLAGREAGHLRPPDRTLPPRCSSKSYVRVHRGILEPADRSQSARYQIHREERTRARPCRFPRHRVNRNVQHPLDTR